KNSPHDVPSYIYYNAIGTKNEAKTLKLTVKFNGYFSPDYAEMKFLKTAHNLLKKVIISQAKIKRCSVPYEKIDTIINEIKDHFISFDGGKWEVLGMKVKLVQHDLDLKYPNARLYAFEYHFSISQDNSPIKKTVELQPKTFVKDKLEIAPTHFEESPFNPKNSCKLMPEFKLKDQYQFLDGYYCITDDINIDTGSILEESNLYRSTNYFYYYVEGEKYEATSIELYLMLMDLDIADSARKKYAKMACNLLKDVVTMQARIKSCPITNKELNTMLNEINNKIIDLTNEQKIKVWTIIGIRITVGKKFTQDFNHDIQKISLIIGQDRSK
ncbi:MAG: hypothetical protein HQK91_14875, partial [Nitrospirae bacterium]|nr:hypothetical protein [Nitrospirota bacterium]